uniref:Uncharacterized protein n=1 Tax=Nelumbo nucifera TaxID=4432 RepID=A0A822YXH3_NELNU|nr:TPA_asm: hypothetical protein HUJ06_008023 [Nelumbo nucifera]
MENKDGVSKGDKLLLGSCYCNAPLHLPIIFLIRVPCIIASLDLLAFVEIGTMRFL